MKIFDDMTFQEKMQHLEKCRLDALECIRNGDPSNLADIADWPDIWGPWLMQETKELEARLAIAEAKNKDLMRGSALEKIK